MPNIDINFIGPLRVFTGTLEEDSDLLAQPPADWFLIAVSSTAIKKISAFLSDLCKLKRSG